uniref:WRKY transcription factor 57.1 n=1 Tax=Jatropha curcas TaxID=180498 RepID=S5CFW3_JATCU|nr:WRKY transcription factor 57.1 [Jatropha curcas]
MGTSLPENVPSTNREKVGEELLHGQEFATQLQFLLKGPCGDLLLADELVVKILRSFNEALSLLSSCEFLENSQNLITTSQVDSVCCDDRRSEDSGESRKRPTNKDRRGCYKRKKTSQSWITVSAAMEDGHAWRKYGQKEILNAKYPRSYFRCTHKYDQGCKATKQVQKMEEDPKMYRTTYIGQHTCRDILKVPQIITSTTQDSYPWESYMLSSDSKIPITPTYNATTIKQEYKEATTPSDLTDNLPSSDTGMWWKGFESTASQSLDMDFVDFDSDFHFDETEFNYLSAN